MPEIHNPNLQSQGPGGGSGGDMRTTMAFIVLAILLFFGYQYFFAPKPHEAPQPAQTQAEHAQKAPPAAAVPAPAQTNARSAKGSKAAPKAAQASIAAKGETETTIENELYKIVLSNRGGEILHWYLKKYNNSDGKPLDIVQPEMAKKFGYPLSFFTYDEGLTKQLSQALYEVNVSGGQHTANGSLLAPASITFHYAENGLDAVKTISFNTSYVISVSAEVKRDGSPVRALISWPAGLGDMDEFVGGSSLARTITFASASGKFAYAVDGKDDSIKASKVSNHATFTEPYNYAAVTDLYFAAAFMPNNPQTTTVVTLHDVVPLPTNPGQANSKTKSAEVLGMAMGSTTGVDQLRLFAGPKETDVLSSIHSIGPDGKPGGPSLSPLIQFGWFSIIAKPLYLAVRWLRNLLGPGVYNWGWAIVIVGIVLNLLTLPSRIMMTKSSLKMARIQPKVDALKRKFANLKLNDPKRGEMNAEMMQLYKSEGVSMYGGCLPMLIQMPLLYAIYEVLENAIELRQAQWYWVPDLSGPDPLYILPILYIFTMFLVQYISPSPGMDPKQRRMMAFVMPIMFGFFMLHFPSGLSLYWMVGNVISLVIQIWINHSSLGKELHEIAARRAAKKKGSIAQRPLVRR